MKNILFHSLVMIVLFTSTSCKKDTGTPYDKYMQVIKGKDIKYAKVAVELRHWMMEHDPHRPSYHFIAPIGFMFDANGPIFYKDRYHLFYLNLPFHDGVGQWEICCRGHATSKDLVFWEDWPIAMWPDTPWDSTAVFSGNAVLDDDGIPTFIYTGHRTHKTALGVLARSYDGMLSWEKKLIMDTPPYPGTPVHWDGQIWKDGDTWYQLCGGTYNEGGAAVLWTSPDLENWTYRNRIYSSQKYGKFWELPYLLPFGDTFVLIIGVHPVRYWIGTYDKNTFEFKPHKNEAEILDPSTHYYAPNPHLVDNNGPGGSQRRIMFGWVRGGKSPTKEVPYWDGMHSIPRVLQLEEDKLIQTPIPELQVLRQKHWQLQNQLIDSPNSGLLKDISGNALEIIAQFDPSESTVSRFGIKLRMSADGLEQTVVYCQPSTSQFGVDGSVVGDPISMKADFTSGERITMHVFLDNSLIEVFVAGRVITKRIFPKHSSLGLDVFCDGGSVNLQSIDIWQMKSIW